MVVNLDYSLKVPSITYGTTPPGHLVAALFMWFLALSWLKSMSPSKYLPISKFAAKEKINQLKYFYACFQKHFLFLSTILQLLEVVVLDVVVLEVVVLDVVVFLQ